MDDEAIVADVRVRTDGGHSEESVLFEQQIQGVRVLGGGLRVVLRDGAVVWTTGRWLQAAAQVPEVWVSGTEARWLAWNAFPGVPEGLVGWPRLVWYSPFTAQSPEVRARDLDPRRVELAWETRVGGESDERGPSVRHFVISAESGEVLESWGVEQ